MAKKKDAQKAKDVTPEVSRTDEPDAEALRPSQLSDDEFRGRVAGKAYELFERRGGEAGHEVEDWLEAERVVREELSQQSSTGRLISPHGQEESRPASRDEPTRPDRHKGDRTR